MSGGKNVEKDKTLTCWVHIDAGTWRERKLEDIGRKEAMVNNLVYICSPYRGEVERNLAYAKELTRKALEYGYTPITPHLYLTQVLDDENPKERELGLMAGQELLKHCEYILVGSRYGISEGMQQEIMIASEAGLKELALTKKGLEKVYG